MKSRVRISALVVAFNEADQIERCLEGLSFCDEIVFVDSESTDQTVEIARRFTDSVWVEPWRGYGAQKQFALEKCRGDWVLWIDADEVVTPRLAASIEKAIEGSNAGNRASDGNSAGSTSGESVDVSPGAGTDAGDDEVIGYSLARRVFYLGDWIGHGGWGEDWVLRLFRRDLGKFRLDLVHEGVELDGNTERLPGALDHYSYRSISHHWSKMDQFTSLWSEQKWGEGARTSLKDILFRPLVRWFKIYVLKQGWRDGWRGIVIASLAATYVLLKYAKLKEKEFRTP